MDGVCQRLQTPSQYLHTMAEKGVIRDILSRVSQHAEALYESGQTPARHLCIYLGTFHFYGLGLT